MYSGSPQRIYCLPVTTWGSIEVSAVGCLWETNRYYNSLNLAILTQLAGHLAGGVGQPYRSTFDSLVTRLFKGEIQIIGWFPAVRTFGTHWHLLTHVVICANVVLYAN